MGDHIKQLGELLSEAGAHVSFSPSRVAPSTLYDAEYHVAVIACAFSSHGVKHGSEGVLISPALLKLLQFVSARPSLVPKIRSWLKQRKHRSLEAISDMPRGYIGDKTHDRAINFLVARGILKHHGTNLAAGPNYQMLTDLHQELEAQDLFSSERCTLTLLHSSKIPQVALEGR